jgi:hypothetical protein
MKTAGMRRVIGLILIIGLCACSLEATPVPTTSPGGPIILSSGDNPYSPLPEDVNLSRAGVVLTSMNLVEEGGDKDPRIVLRILGSLPTPCNELRIKPRAPDEKYRIMIDAYSVVNANLNCEDVLTQFDARMELGRYSPGRYTVWVNDQLVGDFVTY